MLLMEDSPKLNEAISGVKTGDFTYYVLYAIEALKGKIAYLSDEVQKILVSVFKNEANYITEEESKAYNDKPEQMSFFDDVESEEAPVKEEQAFSEEQKKPEPTQEVAKTAPAKKETARPEKAKQTFKQVDGEISIKMDSRSLSEKEAKEYTQYLLECNTALNKKQASFLATHCTLGHYYTIQQYKKFAHCAYETARTSMDKLAEEKYYEKQQIKNKYVYTPIAGNGKSKKEK